MTIYFLARVKNGNVEQSFDFVELPDNLFNFYQEIGFFRKSYLSTQIASIKNENGYKSRIQKQFQDKNLICYGVGIEKKGDGIILITDKDMLFTEVEEFGKEVLKDNNDIASHIASEESVILQNFQFSWKKVMLNMSVGMFISSMAVLAISAICSLIPIPGIITLASSLAIVGACLIIAALTCNIIGGFMKFDNDWDFISSSSVTSYAPQPS